jgi:hypothetical protein
VSLASSPWIAGASSCANFSALPPRNVPPWKWTCASPPLPMAPMPPRGSGITASWPASPIRATVGRRSGAVFAPVRGDPPLALTSPLRPRPACRRGAKRRSRCSSSPGRSRGEVGRSEEVACGDVVDRADSARDRRRVRLIGPHARGCTGVCTARAFAARLTRMTHVAKPFPLVQAVQEGPGWIRTTDPRIMSPLL